MNQDLGHQAHEPNLTYPFHIGKYELVGSKIATLRRPQMGWIIP